MSVKKTKASVNIKKNRLTITVAPKIDKKSMDNLYTEIRFGVADLQPGFDVVTDLSACNLAALSGLPTFRKITNHLVNARVGRVVRVIDESKIIKKQLINLASRIQGYRAEIFSSMEAADEFLTLEGEEQALAFELHNQPVTYQSNGESGSGEIRSLSTQSCEVLKANVDVEMASTISVTIKFDPFEDLLQQFDAEAEVTEVTGDGFTALFKEGDEEFAEKLWQRLVHESQCEPF